MNKHTPIKNLLDATKGTCSMLREAEKQLRLNGCHGHAALCKRHYEKAEAAIAAATS